MFTDKEVSADHTDWLLHEFQALAAIKRIAQQRLVNGGSYPTWIGWSYVNGYFTDCQLIADSLDELAKALISNYQANLGRSIFNLAPQALMFKVKVRQLEEIDKKYGFVYAQCTAR
jgi:thiol-disulfide isomerase/thioredoxin